MGGIYNTNIYYYKDPVRRRNNNNVRIVMAVTFNLAEGSGETKNVQKLYMESEEIEYYDPESKVYAVTIEIVIWH